MFISVFDLFKIGIGPSSSHTVGPMKAAHRFLADLDAAGRLGAVGRVAVRVHGSLALTGAGHSTDKALLLGLSGEQPDLVDPDTVDATLAAIRVGKRLRLFGRYDIPFDEPEDLVMDMETVLPFHSNGLRFTAFDHMGRELLNRVFYSVGGGFVVSEEEAGRNAAADDEGPSVPHAFADAEELLALGRRHGKSIAALMLENELARRSETDVLVGLDRIRDVMSACIDRGIRTEGVLPGRLKVRRRAAMLHRNLVERGERFVSDPTAVMDWINLYALAVSEENAAGSRVVTAPTNGAAGIIPAVLRYYERFHAKASPDGVRTFLLTAAAIGALYKRNASISGAEVGCQGEVGVACSMAAGGLAAAMGGSNEQVENAAEIGMEHNLGLTCDPVGGLVQVPCIERNAIGAIKAINAARIALWGDGVHAVSLDKVIETMRQTGADMQTKYKETARGGLAVNVVEC